MASLIRELIDTLEQQNNIYTSLLDVGAKKKVSIVDNNISMLQQFVREENVLIGKNQRLEKKRLEIFNDIAVVLGKNKEISLKDVIEMINGQDGEKELTELREKMLDVLPKLKTINDQNQELLKMSIDYVDFSINSMRDISNGAPAYYDLAGNEINSSDKKMFDITQ